MIRHLKYWLVALALIMTMCHVARAQSVKYYYWFDNDTENISAADGQLDRVDCSALAYGYHTVNLYVEREGEVSVPKSAWFFKGIMADENQKVDVILFLDGEYYATEKINASGNTTLDLDMLALEKGTHTLSMMVGTPQYINPEILKGTFEALGIAESASIKLQVVDDSGMDVTEIVSITWHKGNELLASGPSVSGVAFGDTLSYSVTLPEELGYQYRDVRRTEFVPILAQHTVTERLTPFQKLGVVGHVKSGDTDAAGVTVAIKQYPNDRFTTETSAETDANGNFEIELIDVPTRFDISGKGYISTYRVIEDLTAENTLPLDIEIEREGLSNLLLDLNYLAATDAGPSEDNKKILGGDINYTMLNDGKEVSVGIYSGNGIPVPESVEIGTTLTIRLESASKLFDPVEASISYEHPDSTVISLTVMERGGIECSYADGYAPAHSMTYLYNAEGRLLASESIGDAATFTGLDNGLYTVVSLVNDGTLGALSSLDDYSTLGMKSGTDYIINRTEVTEGYIASFSLREVPDPDMGVASAITSNARFAATKSSVTASEMVTANLSLNLDEEILAKATEGIVTISLPDNCIFENGSMMVNGKITPASTSGNKISARIGKEDLNSRIRLCLSSEAAGVYNVGASLQLNIGSEIICPIEPLYYYASDYDFAVPAKTAQTSINVLGVSSPHGDVEIYDGDVMIGQTTANADGRWTARVNLNNPHNTSTHSIWTRSSNSAGKSYVSQYKACSYNDKYIVPKSVTMVNTAHRAGNLTPIEVKTVFNLDENREVSSKHYLYWPLYPEFTFLIDFTRNDPSHVESVLLNVFTENDNSITLPAVYDESLQCWASTYSFPSNDLPVNVSVDYTQSSTSQEVIIKPELADFNDIDAEYELRMKEVLEIDRLIAASDGDDILIDSIGLRLHQQIRLLVGGEYSDSQSEPYLERMAEATNTDEAEKAVSEYEIFLKEMLIGKYGSDVANLIYDPSRPAIPFDEKISLNGDININYHYQPGGKGIDGTNIGSWEVDLSNNNLFNNGELQSHNSVTGESVTYDFSDYIHTISENWSVAAERMGQVGNVLGGLALAGQLKYNQLTTPLIERGAYLWDMAEYYATRGDLSEHYPELRKWWYAKSNSYLGKAAKNDLELQKHSKLAFANGALVIGQQLITIGASVANQYSGAKSWKEFEDFIWNHINYSQCRGPQTEEALELIKKYSHESYWRRAGLNCCQIVTNTALAVAGTGSGIFSAGWGAVAAFGIGVAYNAGVDYQRREFAEDDNRKQQMIYEMLLKSSECDDDPHKKRPPYPPYPRNDSDPDMDPSGIVYEGVLSMPVEGVTATIYRNETTEGDGYVWDAADHDQINPQHTDGNGMYAWDVPRGNYRVVFEKEGYETAMTEWLPVPPPQLDVNVSLRKTGPAAVKKATACPEYVSVEFDTYMDGATLTETNLYFEVDGRRVEATVELTNAEGEAPETVLASKVRLVPAEAITAAEVTLHVEAPVATYAGVALPEPIVMTLAVEDEVRALVAPATFAVGYGEEAIMRVQLLPAAAARGRRLHVASSSSVIIGVDGSDVEFDDDGYAYVAISGLLPGNAALVLTVDGYDEPVVSRITVGQSRSTDVAMPEASIPGGSVVAVGTEVTLSCATPDAVIYYTTNGDCPCDPALRKLYTGPIALTKSMTIRAQAVVEGVGESDVAQFSYTVESGNVTGIDAAGDGTLEVGPLPMRDRITVTMGGEMIHRVTVTAVNGAVVIDAAVEAASATIATGHLPAGVYVVTVTSDSTTKSLKAVKL